MIKTSHSLQLNAYSVQSNGAKQETSIGKTLNSKQSTPTAPPSVTLGISKEAVFKSLGDKFDSTNMTYGDMKEVATTLREGNLISEREFFEMTLEIHPIGGRYSDSKTWNFQSQYTAQIEHTKENISKPGMKQQLESLEKILGYLQKI